LVESQNTPFDIRLSKSIGVRNKGDLCPLNCSHPNIHLETVVDNDYYLSGVEKRKRIPGIDRNQYIKVYLAFGVTLVGHALTAAHAGDIAIT
jgi:hypothetical protein